MFRKEPQIKNLSNLKNSERRSTLERCREVLLKDANPEDYKFPTNAVLQTAFSNNHGDRGHIYTDANNVPIWCNVDDNKLHFPTVYTLWSWPSALPMVRTHDIVIEEYIYNGSNLMISGCVPPFDSRLVAGTLCGIVSRKTPSVAVAVGIVDLDLPSYETVYGKKGVAVRILHHTQDELGRKFKVKLMPPTDASIDSKPVSDVEPNVNDHVAKVSTQMGQVSVSDIADVVQEISTEEVDDLLTRAVYYTLISDPSFKVPISASSFISKHVMKNLPPNLSREAVNIKKSSWKKTAKFIKHLEKQGFIKAKGKIEDITIISVNKEKPELKSFVHYKKPSAPKSTTLKRDTQRTGNASSSAKTMMESVILYKAKNQYAQQFMSIMDLPFDQLYSPSELKKSLIEYINFKSLTDKKDPKKALLDDLLFFMTIGHKKTEIATSRLVSKSELADPFLQNNFIQHHQIYKADGTTLYKSPRKGNIPQVQLVTEMKIHKKVVTRVANFEIFGVDADLLASDLKKLCNGSSTINETKINGSSCTEVQVQGPHGPLVIDYLAKQGIPGKWIKFDNKVKGKKKKSQHH